MSESSNRGRGRGWRGRRARRGQSRPVAIHSAPNRDSPPHFDIRTDIDALVERVRAVAIDRPRTPGTVDWAGDDDDSLPDLQDWGVKTISPIIVDGLKALPEPTVPKTLPPKPPSLPPKPADTTFSIGSVSAPSDRPRFNHRMSKSGTSTPRGTHHARNHSTPPALTNHRTPHSRPVITGDAISRLARTINAASKD